MIMIMVPLEEEGGKPCEGKRTPQDDKFLGDPIILGDVRKCQLKYDKPVNQY